MLPLAKVRLGFVKLVISRWTSTILRRTVTHSCHTRIFYLAGDMRTGCEEWKPVIPSELSSLLAIYLRRLATVSLTYTMRLPAASVTLSHHQAQSPTSPLTHWIWWLFVVDKPSYLIKYTWLYIRLPFCLIFAEQNHEIALEITIKFVSFSVLIHIYIFFSSWERCLCLKL